LVADRLEEKQEWYGLEIHHYPDHSKSRSQYLPLLKIAVDEDPNDDRNAYYYARELFFAGAFTEATKEFLRHLSLPKARWGAERAASYRYLAKCNPSHAEEHLLNAVKEDPNRREPRVELALEAYNNQKWELCYEHSTAAIAIKEKPLDYLCESFAWGDAPYDLAAISAWNLDKKEKALEYGEVATKLSPDNERLQSNVVYYKEAINKKEKK
jgi:tetratricopeptide (TPR) repeat protein